MHDSLQFETPENVQVQYTPAGLGTRFIAWFLDQILVSLLMFVVIVVMAIIGVSLGTVLTDFVEDNQENPEKLGRYVIGVVVVVMGLGSFVYYVLSELLWRGQTPGKRLCKIRVVKIDGFSLDPASILIRNIFRLVDHVPLLWIVPVMSKRSQRTGDMVGGTVVISDVTPDLTGIRVQLSERKAIDALFRFDVRTLQRLSPSDIEAVERLLDRWNEIPNAQRQHLTDRLTHSLVAKMQIELPEAENRRRFLEDLLAAELRRQSRLLA